MGLCISKTQDSKGDAVEQDREDRISGLPRDIIDCIIDLLPAHDAARTSILSKNWRYIWATLPNVVLNKLFCEKIAGNSQYVLDRIVDKILLQHHGDIVKFVLDVSEVQLSPDTDIDRWMLYVIRHGVKELVLNLPKNNYTYKLPSYVFTCPTLTRLELFNCGFKPPNCFLDFQNLRTLHMENITVEPTTELCVIKAPLVNLALKYCDGTQNLKIVSSQLKSLVVIQSHYDLDLNCFINCKTLTDLFFVVYNPKRDDEISTLKELLFNLPALEVLALVTSDLELLSASAVPKGLLFMPNCLWHLKLAVNFSKIGQTSYVLQLIKNTPNLSKLQIWQLNARDDGAEVAMEYLDSPVCLDRPLNKLKYVIMHWFTGSKTEFLFVKLFLARSPCLLRMRIKQKNPVGSTEKRNITTELSRFRRASSKRPSCFIAAEFSRRRRALEFAI